jgi:hypothetical protein
MDEAQPSRTALGVAIRRASHQLYDVPPLVLDDPVAVPMLGEVYRSRLEDSTLITREMSQVISRRDYGYAIPYSFGEMLEIPCHKPSACWFTCHMGGQDRETRAKPKTTTEGQDRGIGHRVARGECDGSRWWERG